MPSEQQHSSEQQQVVQPERPERRISTGDRRQSVDRRTHRERRTDSRLAPSKPHKSIKTWLRSVVKARLGVDRRKSADRRASTDRRYLRIESILTKEELADLLAD
jgi:hypothetical protein